ncbi:MAG TPA: tRNA preQ1(34) S-adenosylmethionine ribosyltransferase-isomerase QueA [Casimicrobiaceae bacterium]|nr:tRNA preQ1(34) S-adenosylmethionine ribosyltransferase-isomerase QueA [Casimicrobiaceae bacterium]
MSERRAYRLSDFDYELPQDLIAQRPARERAQSRLLHVGGSKLADLSFAALPDLLAPGDVLVVNDTRVIPARLRGRRETGGRVELLLERIVAPDEAWMQLAASHPPKPGGRILLDRGNATATVLERDGRFVRLRFAASLALDDYFERYGEVPLPPYIARAVEPADAERYQTIYARQRGAVAAPTAGLHFEQAMLERLRERGIVVTSLTLHVGAGTFEPVDEEDLAQHHVHRERYEIPGATAAAIEGAHGAGRSVIAVGTTTLRALESAVSPEGVRAGAAETTLFITPGFRFRVVDRLITNFHLPRSTLLMLVSAFGGFDTIRNAYAHAIRQRYRFYSYGDAMLLERDPSVESPR